MKGVEEFEQKKKNFRGLVLSITTSPLCDIRHGARAICSISRKISNALPRSVGLNICNDNLRASGTLSYEVDTCISKAY